MVPPVIHFGPGSAARRPFGRFAASVRRFAKDESGVISAEALVLIPLLTWIFLAMFVYWDAYRAQNIAVKGSYAIADMISRESLPVTPTYVTGMHNVFRYINSTEEGTWVRVSSIQYRSNNDTFRVLWSLTSNPGRAPAHAGSTVTQMKDRIPRPAHNRSLILVETWRQFTPAFRVGLDRRTFYNVEVVWPRFLEPLPLDVGS